MIIKESKPTAKSIFLIRFFLNIFMIITDSKPTAKLLFLQEAFFQGVYFTYGLWGNNMGESGGEKNEHDGVGYPGYVLQARRDLQLIMQPHTC